jgi:glycosyltransferase involved in cell wall biosynthesis
MKVLQVSLKPPYPKVDGGCMAIAAVTEGLLANGNKVKCLTMATGKHPFQPERIPESILKNTDMESVKMDTRIKPLDAFLNLFEATSYNIDRFYSEEFEKRLLEIVKEHDFEIIILESVYCTPYIDAIRKHTETKILVRAHNVEYKIWDGLANSTNGFLRRWYLRLLASRLKNYEIYTLNKADGVLVITSLNEDQLKTDGVTAPFCVIPVGMDIKRFPKLKPIRSPKLYHIGAMDWEPNIEGVNWFVDDIWPQISSSFPDVECHLAGRKMPDYLLDEANGNLNIKGEVESVVEFVKDKPIAIVPLLSGSGMRVKIVEALALGKVVISTSLGADGIPYEDGKNMLIANTPEEFVDQIQLLTENPKLIPKIGKEARKLAETEFDQRNVGTKLTYFCQQLS